jgi:2'-5' RNA ligase
MRLFIAIPLGSVACDELARVSAQLRSGKDGFRWTSPESWHITLQFLGNTSAEQLGRLCVSLRDVRSPAFPIQLGTLGFFDRAGVFFVDVNLSSDLRAHRQRVIEATTQCGFPPEQRPYHPHITLARIKKKSASQSRHALDAAIQSATHFSRFVVGEFRLYESFVGEAAHYEVRQCFPLIEFESLAQG